MKAWGKEGDGVTNCAEVTGFVQGAWGLDGHWVVGDWVITIIGMAWVVGVKVYAECG